MMELTSTQIRKMVENGETLPDNMTVGTRLNLSGCTGLTALPDNMTVGGTLNLSGCTGLTALPDNMTVGGTLDLDGCTGLTALPDNMTVGGILDLDGCTGLTALPDNMTVGEWLYLDTGTIKNITLMSKPCGVEKRIGFVAFVNGEPQIALGCFLGNKADAVKAIRKKYDLDSEYEAIVLEAFNNFEKNHIRNK